MGSGRLSGKVAIVTGAASGIGKATAELFRSEGAEVIAADIAEADGIVRTDAGRDEDVRHLVDHAVAKHGGLDIVFANAGISGGLTSIFEQTAEDWAEILRINLIGPFLAIKHAAPILKARGGGSIICTASVAGLRSGAGGAAYSASKAGVINLVTTAAQQLSGTGIRVNAICPGLIETGMTEMIYSAAREAGHGPSHRRIEPAQPRRRARRNCQGRLVPGVGGIELRQRPGARRRRRSVEQPSQPPPASTSRRSN